MTTRDGIPGELRDSLGAEDRKLATRCLVLLGLLSGGSLIGVASSLYLANNHPLVLIGLSPLFRHLVLVAPVVDPVAFVSVATARSLALFLVCFYLGRAFGPGGLTWLESRAPTMGQFVRWLERLFERASYAAVLLFAGPAVATIAGVAGMRALVFTGLAAVSVVFRLLLILELGDWLREPLRDVREFIGEYWLPGTVLLVALLLLNRWRRRRTGDVP